MPTDAFYYINDEDLANSIAYLKTIPAVDADIPPKRIGPLARALFLMTDFPLVQAEKVPLSDPRPAKIPAGPTREYGDYLATTRSCKSCFRKSLRDGVRPGGRVLSAVMPWPYTRLMTDEEIHALWLYVHSVPPKDARGH
jgi:hypothetical protein